MHTCSRCSEYRQLCWAHLDDITMTSLGLFFSVNESSYVSLIANRCSLSDALKQLECNGVFSRWGMSPLTWVKAQQQQQQQQCRAATSALFAFPSWLLSVASDSSSGWTSASRAQWKELPGTAAPLGHIDPLLCPSMSLCSLCFEPVTGSKTATMMTVIQFTKQLVTLSLSRCAS